MLPDDVLQVFHDWHQFVKAYQLDIGQAAYELLSFDSTIADWRDACELSAGKKLGRYLNKVFAITATDKEWLAVLVDSNKLFDLCEFIANRSPILTEVGDVILISSTSVTLRVFKELRSRLVATGVPLADARPSTQLEPFIVGHFDDIVSVVASFAPGAMPTRPSRWKIADPLSIVLSLTLIYILFQLLYRYSASVLGATMLTGFLCILVVQFWDKRHASAYFRDIETMADLTRLIVQHRRRL